MLEPKRHESASTASAHAGLKPVGGGTRPGGWRRSPVLGCAWLALRSTARVMLAGLAAVSLVWVAAVFAFRTIDPPGSMLMWSQKQGGRAIDQRWVPLTRISPALVRAVIMSEDNQFCRHWGIDVRELTTALKRAEQLGREPSRGASTISMQLTKNLLLWNDKSYVRKAFELPLTVFVELVWPKRRIMEVYLNIAEWGPGVFGAEAASQHHFGKPVARLTDGEAALLAVALPNPFTRVAGKPSANLKRVADVIDRRVKTMGKRAECVLGAGPFNGPASSFPVGRREIARISSAVLPL